MSYQKGGVLSVSLRRDFSATPWGFRLQGGFDLNAPLTIQRVFLGSPSEGELHRGDLVLKIGDRDTSRMTHNEATELIRNSGNNLNLIVHRSPGPHSPASTPTTPKPAGMVSGGHPLAGATYRPAGPPAYVSPQSPGITITTQNVTVPASGPYQDGQYQYELRQGFLVPEPLVENKIDALKEQAKITNQTYRTTPLITPSAKPRRDVTIGSYLRHVKEPYFTTMKMPVDSLNNPEAIAKKVQETVNQVASGSNSPCFGLPASVATSGGSGGRVTPGADGPKVVHNVYNSPIHLYSTQNVADTLAAQTGLKVGQGNLQPSGSASPQQQQHSPRSVGSAGSGAGMVKPGTKLSSAADITMSPTYQMIHGEEWRDIRKSDLQEHRPVQNQLYAVQPDYGNAINAFGAPKGRIQQSNSFKTIMSTVMTPKLL
uniref:Z band alternatively spliced pdz motif protein 66 n=1 Tax=Rhipicephalus zambeziensis TaxID=60191 RepID=A0A224ZC41_9ACAR